MDYPNKQQCHEMIRKMNMMDHIIEHSEKVCLVAVFLADRLIMSGLKLNRDLIVAASLLHDITKTRSIESGENHADSGGLYIENLGYPEVANIIRQHVKLDQYFKSDVPDEAEIVNYSDKRVLHEKVVSLEERMSYILERYAKGKNDQKRYQQLWKLTKQSEARIFCHLDFPPDDLTFYVQDSSDWVAG